MLASQMVLASQKIVTVLPAVDMNRAKKFYTEKLGLKIETERPAGVMLAGGSGTHLFLYEHSATKADHTAVMFWVDDIEAEVVALKQKGIVFEEYDMPGLKTENGIATIGRDRSAWFKDSEGNIIAISQIG
jgi:predicted enzyme related to lactoylglutathione lyase